MRMTQKSDEVKKGAVYFTIYIKHLYNGTGYIDVCLETDQLLKDYMQFLDIGVRGHKTYPIAHSPGMQGTPGQFLINLTEIAAITIDRKSVV